MCAEYGSTISLNGNTIYVRNITVKKVQKTRKSVIGKTLSQTRIIGLSAQQWEISITGIITENLSTERATLEAMDSVTKYAYIDGIHDCNVYVVPGSLQFDDKEDDASMMYNFTISLVEE